MAVAYWPLDEPLEEEPRAKDPRNPGRAGVGYISAYLDPSPSEPPCYSHREREPKSFGAGAMGVNAFHATNHSI